jgi:probable rRNA maturation factor
MYQITVQQAANKSLSPKVSLLKEWATKAMQSEVKSAELTIRIVDVEEMTNLNLTYRNKQGPTNVLSFPFELPTDIQLEIPILGDIIICAAIVNEEAQEQKKEVNAHWAHMVVHGSLHLLGYDHENDDEANIMESLEIAILQQLGFDNPYLGEKNPL